MSNDSSPQRTPQQQLNCDLADMVLKMNEAYNMKLSQLELRHGPSAEISTIRQRIQQLDFYVIGLDRGSGHAAIAVSFVP
jgi:hypothetical protein